MNLHDELVDLFKKAPPFQDRLVSDEEDQYLALVNACRRAAASGASHITYVITTVSTPEAWGVFTAMRARFRARLLDEGLGVMVPPGGWHEGDTLRSVCFEVSWC